jgi:signal transduction histidine kinase
VDDLCYDTGDWKAHDDGGRRSASVLVMAGSGAEMNRRPLSVLAWTLLAFELLLLASLPWVDHLLLQADRPDLTFLDAFAIPPSVAALTAGVVGAVLASRRPHHPVGWLLLAQGLMLAISGASVGYIPYGLLVRPGAVPAVNLVARVYPATISAALAAVGFVLLLTPTGSPPSRRWRRWARVLAGAVAIALVASMVAPGSLDPLAQFVAGPLDPTVYGGALRVANQLALLISILTIVAGAGSLVVRFRHAVGVERQQLRWVALAAALTGLSMLASAVLIAAGEVDLAAWASVLGVAFLPLATGAAILRYRLYDLDYVVSRAVVYGLLTAAGIGVYVGVVNLSGWLLRERAGLGGSLVATAVVAVGFAPARDRLQRWVDRRLYGDRHDPVRAVARLGERLRDGPGGAADGDALAGVLQGVCEALRLPSASLRVAGVVVASFGHPSRASESIALEHEGQHIGAMVVGLRAGEPALGVADRKVLEVLAAPVAVALHAVLLSQELQRSRERLVAAREEERRRLRRDLHDGLGPVLTAVTLKADAARSALSTAPDRTDALLAELRGDANQAIADLRRVIYDLRPAALDELGLLGALSQQVDRFGRQGLSITLQAPPALPMLPAAVEVAAYRIITEALTNITRHAHAHQVTIAIAIAIDGDLCLAVQDDGTTSTANGDGWRPGTGLQSMAERAAEVGGTLEVGPTATGGRVYASLPLELP